MKKDIATYEERCMSCLQVKAKHLELLGMLQPLEIPILKWEMTTMDYVLKLSEGKRRKWRYKVTMDY